MSRLEQFLNTLTPRQAPTPRPDGYGVAAPMGHSQEQFAPDEYGNYIATSNDVYAAAMLRAKSLAKLGLLYADGAGLDIPGGDKVGALLRRVNPHWTWRRMVVQYELSMAIWGQCHWVIERDRMGQPTELWWVKPTRMKPVISATDYISRFIYTPPGTGTQMLFDPDEVVWFRYPNIIDEFTGLAPLAAARLAADVASASMQANKLLFDQGLMMGGAFFPPDGTDLTPEQATELEEKLSKRFRGVDKAHRWAVFRQDFTIKELGVTPKDAQFVESMNISFRQVCRAMGVPPPLLGDAEFATLANLSVYEKQLWEQTMEFEAEFFTEELNEQLIPKFRASKVASIGLDLSKVAALQEDRQIREEREAAQIKDGRLKINEWRVKNGLEEVPWGDEWWLSSMMLPASTAAQSEPRTTKQTTQGDNGQTGSERAYRARDPYTTDESRFAASQRALYARQYDAVVSTLNAGRTAQDTIKAPFNMARWVAEYEKAGEPLLIGTIQKAAIIGGETIGVPLSTDLAEIEGLAEAVAERAAATATEYAVSVNEALWNDLRTAIGDGFDLGEDIPTLTGRVQRILGSDAAEWKAKRIAATETTKATSWGQMEVWRVSGVARKRWVTQGDDAVRDSHAALAGTTVGIRDGFTVGGCIADAPGLSGCAAEDVNCFPPDTNIEALSRIGAVTRRGYQGDMVTVRTLSGAVLTGTPNHQVLTLTGWRPLNTLAEGDYLVGRGDRQRIPTRYPNPDHRPTDFGELFRLANQFGAKHRVAGREPQFHGDGTATDVDVVTFSRFLQHDGQATVGEPPGELVFPHADILEVLLAGQGTSLSNLVSVGASTAGHMSGVDLGDTLQSGHTGPLHSLSGGAASEFYTSSGENPADSLPRHGVALGDQVDRFTRLVTGDKIVGIEMADYSGHVLNLETGSGWYVANSIVVHNCRCRVEPVGSRSVRLESDLSAISSALGGER